MLSAGALGRRLAIGIFVAEPMAAWLCVRRSVNGRALAYWIASNGYVFPGERLEVVPT